MYDDVTLNDDVTYVLYIKVMKQNKKGGTR
jgi:hypothetical protein